MSEQATLDVSLIFNAHGEHEVGKEDTAVERLEELFDRHRVRQRVEPTVTVTLPEEQEIDLGDWTFPEVTAGVSPRSALPWKSVAARSCWWLVGASLRDRAVGCAEAPLRGSLPFWLPSLAQRQPRDREFRFAQCTQRRRG
jgi:hypothetical protein